MSVRRLLVFVIVTAATIYAQFDNSGCSSSKGCMLDPPGCDPNSNCNHAFSWKVNGDYVDMQVLGLASGTGNDYLAVGFSDDRSMGNEPVTYCTFGQQSSINLAFNTAKIDERVTDYTALANDVILVSPTSANNGRLYCAFRQKITPSQSHPRVLALNRSIYPLVAFGAMSGQALNVHETNPGSSRFPFVAPKSLSLADTASYGSVNMSDASTVKSDSVCTNYYLPLAVQIQLKKAHATMMILAWFIFIATAIMFARYFKGHWPNTKPMGLHMWFHFHRTFNIIGVLLITASFICIFTAECWLWKGPSVNGLLDTYWKSVHSLTGVLACCLAWAQPIGAIFRCHPGKPLRPIFNWLHRFSGIAGWSLAATTIVIAAKEFTKDWTNPDAALGLVIAYLVFLGVILILHELITIYNMMTGHSTVQVEAVEVQSAPKGPYDRAMLPPLAVSTTVVTNSKSKVVRTVLMGLFIVIGSGLAIALAVLVALAKFQ